MGNLTSLLAKIRPAIDEEKTVTESRDSSNDEFVEKVTEINVKRTLQSIVQRSPILKEMLEKREILLVGGVHNIATGEVDFHTTEL
jgi:carbonic anhydrase